MDPKTVMLVTGATGMVGLEVCRQLAGIPGIEVRAALHSPEKADLLPPEVTPVPFDFQDPSTVDAALQGADRLFLSTPGGPIGPPATRVIVEAAEIHHPQRIVKLSSFLPERPPQAPTDLWALETEAMVRDSGISYTLLQPPWFDQNFSQGYFVPMVAQGILALPFGEGRAAWVDTGDVAAVAVKALLEDGHDGQTYAPTGPEPVTLSEIAAALSRVTGREIRFVHLTDGQWIEASQAAGQPEEVARATLALISKTRDGHHADEITGDIERLTGRKPRSFAHFAADHGEMLRSLVSPS